MGDLAKDTRFSSHGQYLTKYHICWVTKYRYPVLSAERVKYLDRLFLRIFEKIPGCEILESNILEDHIHLVVVIPPRYAVKDVIGRLKGISSSKLKERFGASGTVWSPGYFVSTVGVPEEKIISYVRNQ
jgi:putative transposase